MPSDPAKVEPSPREELLSLVRDYQERVAHTTPEERRAYRALELLASCSPLMVIPEDVAREALRILRGER